MLTFVITWSLRHRWLVLILALGLVIVGVVALKNLTIDAFPDTTPVQVQINTEAGALVATEVERMVTFPIEMAIAALYMFVRAWREVAADRT